MVREDDALEYHSSQPAGKISVTATKPCLTQRDLSLAYTPGVAVPCLKIHDDPDLVYKYTGKGNLVAVVTNGTAVLGLGNIGPAAGKPVMEGKAVLFKRFADIDVFDIELAANNAEDVIRACQMLEPTFGGINLEDIKAPECFEIEEKLRKSLRIPVFHDDQHGTAIIAGAAMLNGLELAGKTMAAARIVINGAGAAAVACARHFIRLGVTAENIIMCDSKGVLYEGRQEGMNPYKAMFARRTEARTLTEAMRDSDVFVGLSSANCVTPLMLKGMAANPLVLALSNPDPEIPYPDAVEARPDAIVATGRSDYPNQVNNVLGFPAIFRGALDARATTVTAEMMMAATQSLAELAKEDVPDSVCRIYGGEDLQFGRNYIIPKPFDPRVVLREAPAVVRAAMQSGVARVSVDLEEYGRRLENRLSAGTGVTRLLIRKARHKVCRVLFPEGDNPIVLRACRTVLDEGIATPVLLGNRAKIERLAAEVHLDTTKLEIATIDTHPRLPFYVEELYRMRQRKGITRVEAELALRNPNLFGAMMVHLDDADALVTGLSTHYPDTVRPLLQVIPLRPGVTRAAGVYLVIPSTRAKLYFLADCTVNIDPTAEELAEIALGAAETARRFDVEPRVAFLSYSSFGSSRHASSEKVRQAVQILKTKAPDLNADGEMQADTAVLPERLEGTYPFSTLKGGANVLIFPNLDSANIAYKLLSSLGGVQVVGPILTGPAKPVHVLQREASVADVVNLAALAAVEAQELTHSKSGAEARLMRRMLRGD
ncbi:MAG: NADP-dependent malic enzyme [Bryobacterales bacterium]|nr:NADP-dependent malic enzyme [Bryobacterales bacterium]